MNQDCPYCNINLPLEKDPNTMLFKWHLNGHMEEPVEPKKNYREVKQHLIDTHPEGGMGFNVKCPRCNIKSDFLLYIEENQCPVCNPVITK